MTSSGFWRDLAEQFRALPYGYSVTGLREFSASEGKLCWRIVGGHNEITIYEPLARRAAVGIANAETTDLLSAWLDALMQEPHAFRPGPPFIERNPDGTEKARHQVGRMGNLPYLSAMLCKKLEAEAVQSEFDKKQQQRRTLDCFYANYGNSLKKPTRQRELKTPKESREKAISSQLNSLKEESHQTTEELAELVDLNVRSVQRHLSGDSVPYDRHLRAYEREFSKLLGRRVIISKKS